MHGKADSRACLQDVIVSNSRFACCRSATNDLNLPSFTSPIAHLIFDAFLTHWQICIKENQWTMTAATSKICKYILADECVKGLVRSIASLMTSIITQSNWIKCILDLSFVAILRLIHSPTIYANTFWLSITSKSNVLIAFATQRTSSLLRFQFDLLHAWPKYYCIPSQSIWYSSIIYCLIWIYVLLSVSCRLYNIMSITWTQMLWIYNTKSIAYRLYGVNPLQ